MIQVIIDSYTIPQEDIASIPVTDSELSYDDNVVVSTSSVSLNNCSDAYSDTNGVSIFFGTTWLNKPYSIYDTDKKVFIFVGVVKNLEVNDGNRTVKVSAVNYIRELVGKNLVYSSASVTVAEAIYAILSYAGVPSQYINLSSFSQASGYHATNGLYVSISYASTDNKSCISVVSELCKISQCGLYSRDNIIYLSQWTSYNNELGYSVTPDIVAGSFTSSYSNDLFNAYNIAYKNSTAVAYTTGIYSGTSGDSVYNIPNVKVNGSTAVDFKILYTTKAGADFAGTLAMYRYFCPTKMTSFVLPWVYNYLNVGDQIDLTYGDYIREPIELTAVKPDANKRTVEIKGIFRNLPVERKSRDITAPSAPSIFTVLPYTKSAVVKVTDNTEADFDKYKLYFATNNDQWESEFSDNGISPVDYINTLLSVDGFRYMVISGLQIGLPYYYKCSAVDTSTNESSYSSVKMSPFAIGTENKYRCDGDIYTTGIGLSIGNSSNGSVPSDLSLVMYGDGLYGEAFYQCSSIYESFIYKSLNTKFDYFSFAKTGTNGYVQYQIRESADNITWSAWSIPTTLNSTDTVVLTSKYFQFRCLFHSINWSPSEPKLYVTEIQ